MKHEIALTQSLRARAAPAYDVLRSILDAIAHHEPPYESTTLSVALEGLGPPFTGRVSVPVKINASHNALRYESEITIQGATMPAAFPTFAGTLSITPLREYGSELWMQGDYEPPLGKAGSIIDITLLNNAARSSLQSMLTWLAGEIIRRT